MKIEPAAALALAAVIRNDLRALAALEPGLGLQLKREARKTLLWIREHPDLPRLRPKGYRQLNTASQTADIHSAADAATKGI